MIIIKHGEGRYELRSRRRRKRFIRVAWGTEAFDSVGRFYMHPCVSICKWDPPCPANGDEDEYEYLQDTKRGSNRFARRLWRILEPHIGHEIYPSREKSS